MTKARDLANASTALSAVSATELGYLDGVTSAVQTQMDAKAPSSTAVTLTGTQTLTNKTLTSPALTTPTISTATTNGDILYGTGSGALARLGIGTTDQILKVTAGVPAWSTPAATTPTFIGCIAINTDQNTSFSTVGTEVSIPFAQTELVDTNGFHDTATNPSRFTVPSGYAGKYLIQLNTTLASHNPDLYIYILKNGSKLVSADGIVNGQIVRQANAYPQGDTLNVGLVVTAAVADYFQWNIVVQSAGSGTNTIDRARCSFTYLGA